MDRLVPQLDGCEWLVITGLWCFTSKKMSDLPQSNDIIFYNTHAGGVKIEVIFNEETFWLTQKRMAELFGAEVPAISKHLANIYDTHELKKEEIVSILETVQRDA